MNKKPADQPVLPDVVADARADWTLVIQGRGLCDLDYEGSVDSLLKLFLQELESGGHRIFSADLTTGFTRLAMGIPVRRSPTQFVLVAKVIQGGITSNDRPEYPE